MGVHRCHVRHPGPLLVVIAARTAEGAVAIAWGNVQDEEEVMIRMRRWHKLGRDPDGNYQEVHITEWRLFGLILLLRKEEYRDRPGR